MAIGLAERELLKRCEGDEELFSRVISFWSTNHNTEWFKEASEYFQHTVYGFVKVLRSTFILLILNVILFIMHFSLVSFPLLYPCLFLIILPVPYLWYKRSITGDNPVSNNLTLYDDEEGNDLFLLAILYDHYLKEM